MKEKQKNVKDILAHCDKWDAMYKRLGAYGVAKLMVKTKAWKDYCQKWPLDYIESWTTVRQLEDLEPFLAHDNPSVEDEVDTKLLYEKFVDSLTDRQRAVWEGIRSGMNNREIEAGMGFSNNNTVRWYKHKIKSKYLQMKYNTTNEWICKECAYQWRSPERQNCPQCNNKSILKTKKNIPNIPEDI